MENRIVPARHIETQFIDQNSRFITNAGPAFSVAEAQDFIAQVKDKYPGATHHVPVYLIGHGSATVAHCSDDGEPSGTAGRPALAVLQGSGFGDIVLVVTRYFGGTKLGTGGTGSGLQRQRADGAGRNAACEEGLHDSSDVHHPLFFV